METFSSMLKKKHLSATAIRCDILKVLSEQSHPIKITELGLLMEVQSHPSSLYRSLSVLVNAGLVYQTDFRDGVAYFEYQSEHPHHHMICTTCSDHIDIDICMHAEFKELEKKYNFTISSHMFEIFGLCKNCS